MILGLPFEARMIFEARHINHFRESTTENHSRIIQAKPRIIACISLRYTRVILEVVLCVVGAPVLRVRVGVRARMKRAA